jgi:hypothetical protein
VGGDIVTTNDNATFIGAVTLTSPLTVNTGASVGDITFSAGVNGSVAGAQGLTLTAGTGDISTGTIGGTTGLGAVTINSARNLSVLDVKATSLTQVASSGTSLYTGNITTTGGAGVSLSGNLVSVGNITSANNPIALYSDRISMNGSVDAGNSSVTLGASSNGTIIDLGGPDVTGTTLGLTNAELSKVTAANLIIGNATNTGGIRVTDSISIASKAMSLTTGSNITFATNGALAGNLASTEITLNTGLSGGVVGASDTAVDVVANDWTAEDNSTLSKMLVKGMLKNADGSSMKTSDFRIILKSDTIRNGPLTVLSDMPTDAKEAIAKAFMTAHTADKAAFDKLSDGKNQPWKAGKTEEWKPVVELVQFVDSLRRKN